MDADKREDLAIYLQNKLHKHHLQGYMLGSDEVLEYIDNFFKTEDLYKKKAEIEAEIMKMEGEIK